MNTNNLKLIVAYDKNNVIGRGLTLPFKLSNDLKRVKELTVNKQILMGRRTWESLNKKPLPNRVNIVVSSKEKPREETLNNTKVIFVNNIQDGLEHSNQGELFIFGGSSVYEQCLPYVTSLYITEVDTEIKGEELSYFPKLDKRDWLQLNESSHKKDDKNEYDYKFKYLIRK